MCVCESPWIIFLHRSIILELQFIRLPQWWQLSRTAEEAIEVENYNNERLQLFAVMQLRTPVIRKQVCTAHLQMIKVIDKMRWDFVNSNIQILRRKFERSKLKSLHWIGDFIATSCYRSRVNEYSQLGRYQKLFKQNQH